MSATGSVQSGWTSCVKFKVSDSLLVPQAQFKVYERHVLSPKWATVYDATGSVQSGWTPCVEFKVSDSILVPQAQFKVDERHVLS